MILRKFLFKRLHSTFLFLITSCLIPIGALAGQTDDETEQSDAVEDRGQQLLFCTASLGPTKETIHLEYLRVWRPSSGDISYVMQLKQADAEVTRLFVHPEPVWGLEMEITAISPSEVDFARLRIKSATPFSGLPRWSGTLQLNGIFGHETEDSLFRG